MSDEHLRRATETRRDYWQQQHDAALAAGDPDAAAMALHFVLEYDQLLELADLLGHGSLPDSPMPPT